MSEIRSDAIVGTGSATLGSVGITIQLITDYLSLGVVALNLLLAVGGLWLVWLRIRRLIKGEKRRHDDP